MLSEICRIKAFLVTHPLTRRRRLWATARVLRWQIASRIRDEVIVDWIGGTRFAAGRGMTGVTGNIYAGLHEFADMAFVRHFLRAGDLFADVSANIGSYTVLASGVVGCSTVAFEPDPAAAAALYAVPATAMRLKPFIGRGGADCEARSAHGRAHVLTTAPATAAARARDRYFHPDPRGFLARAIIDFASTGILPTRRNSISVNPASLSNMRSV
jgi:hypothetical protein